MITTNHAHGYIDPPMEVPHNMPKCGSVIGEPVIGIIRPIQVILFMFWYTMTSLLDYIAEVDLGGVCVYSSVASTGWRPSTHIHTHALLSV